jgi:hypothetical protein
MVRKGSALPADRRQRRRKVRRGSDRPWRSRSNRHQQGDQAISASVRDRPCSVRRTASVVRVLVGFDEHAGNAEADRGPRHGWGELALAAGRAAQSAGLLDRMGGVHDHRIAGLRHRRQRPHVGNQRIITKCRPRVRSRGSDRCRCWPPWRRHFPCPRAQETGPS